MSTDNVVAKQDAVNGIKSWDEDNGTIPRLQIVDEHQHFTYVGRQQSVTYYHVLVLKCVVLLLVKTCQAIWENGHLQKQDFNIML